MDKNDLKEMAEKNAGEMKEPRLGFLNELLELSERFKHVNQYV